MVINKMIKIYDCFNFNNEKELINFRIDYLKDIVDYFIIVEADKTQSGLEKQQNFSFDWFDEKIKNKIRYYFISFPNEDSLESPIWTSSEDSIPSWKREEYQRKYLKNGIFDSQSDDIIIVSDLDEIPNKEKILKLKENHTTLNDFKLVSLAMNMFNFSIDNLKLNEDNSPFIWYHPKILKSKNLICTNKVRLSQPNAIIENGGWHFTYFGGEQRLKNKLKDAAHREADNENQLKDFLKSMKKENYTKLKYPKELLPDLIFTEKYKDFFAN
jgi:beta-1,4-mannosyl-glycoprotein beta-1,4-N-acetylglucosaminyltransferase